MDATGRADPTVAAAVDDKLNDDFALMGASFEPDEIIKPKAFEVLAVNHHSFAAFLECATQWRTAATPVGLTFIGLDYASCKLVLEDLHAPRHVFADLRVIEHEALKHLNKREVN